MQVPLARFKGVPEEARSGSPVICVNGMAPSELFIKYPGVYFAAVEGIEKII